MSDASAKNGYSRSRDWRLSAVGAFLGHIDSSMRLIKCYETGGTVHLVCVADTTATELTREMFSVAATEIAADLHHNLRLKEEFVISEEPIPKENVINSGWIFKRFENEWEL